MALVASYGLPKGKRQALPFGMRKPRLGEAHRGVQKAVDQIDLTPVVDYVEGVRPSVKMPKHLAEMIAQAITARLTAFGLSLGNQ